MTCASGGVAGSLGLNEVQQTLMTYLSAGPTTTTTIIIIIIMRWNANLGYKQLERLPREWFVAHFRVEIESYDSFQIKNRQIKASWCFNGIILLHHQLQTLVTSDCSRTGFREEIDVILLYLEINLCLDSAPMTKSARELDAPRSCWLGPE